MNTPLSEAAEKAVAFAVGKSIEQYAKPVCVSICDAHGHLMAFRRMDGAPLRSIAIAIHKAYTAVMMGSTTEAFGLRLKNEGVDARAFCDDKLTPLPGGTPILDGEGRLRGGVGISGLKPDQDGDLAVLAAKEAARWL